MKKKRLILAAVFLSACVAAGCSNTETQSSATETMTEAAAETTTEITTESDEKSGQESGGESTGIEPGVSGNLVDGTYVGEGQGNNRLI